MADPFQELDECTLGIVLTHQSQRAPNNWAEIVPEIFIYRNSKTFSQAIKNIIDRQLAFKQLAALETSYVFTPVAIIIDKKVTIAYPLAELSISNSEFMKIVDDLAIKIIYGSPADFVNRVLPTVWKWSDRGVGRKDIRELSTMDTPIIQRRIRAKFRQLSN